MNTKLSICLIAITTVLYGCTALPPKSEDGSHLKDIPMSRDFVMDLNISEAIQADFKEKGSKGSKKIFSIKPTGTTQPRAVILLEKKMFRINANSPWKIGDYNLKVRKKNIDICKGFMELTSATVMEEIGEKEGDILKADRKNHVVTYMPAKGKNKKTLPKNADGCASFISDGYDYKSAETELLFILKGSEKIGKSPYLAVYESPKSPYSSMVLSLGNLSPQAITLLASEWPELIMKVYEHGDNIDPVAGIAVMLENDESLRRAQQDATWENIEITATGGLCGAAAASTPVSLTLGVLIALPACQTFFTKAKEAIGY